MLCPVRIGKADNRMSYFLEYGHASFVAITEFIDKPLSSIRIHNNAVWETSSETEKWRFTKAVFVGRCPRSQLYPAELDRSCPDLEAFFEYLCRGTWLVGTHHICSKRGILDGTKGNVRTESPGRQYNTTSTP